MLHQHGSNSETKIGPAAPPPIDVSHLTEEERRKIQEVLERQKQVEKENASIQRYCFFVRLGVTHKSNLSPTCVN